MMHTGTAHIPVMLNEVLAHLSPKDGGIYVDGTFGAGGYSRAVLDAASCSVYAIDRDATAVQRGRELEAEYKGRFNVIEGCFGSMAELLDERGVGPVDGVALDLGVSSMQIDTAERGFSFKTDGPLDMRMGTEGASAADAVNDLDESALATIIRELGEERHARRVARAIVEARLEAPITRTLELARVVRSVVPKSKDGIDPATRTFQAIRIHVNDELGEVDRGLIGAEQVLAQGGRLAVVTFHSLEDRRVKMFLRDRSGAAPRPSRHLPIEIEAGPAPTFSLLNRRAITATNEEIRSNPRSRSAKLRTAERTAAAPWNSEGPA